MQRTIRSLLTALAFAAAPALAQDALCDRSDPVEIAIDREFELGAYREVLAGLDAFERRRAELAPLARELRFALPCPGGEAAVPSAHIVSDEGSILLPLAADGSFGIPRMEQLDEDANVLVLAAGRRTSAWPRVRSRGLAQDTLRLGDLRLECAVAVAIARAGLAWMSRAALDRAAGADVWGLEGVTWWLSEGAAVRRAVIRQPGRRAELAVRDGRLAVPVAERAWSNDALISIERAWPA